ncbi:MAG: hypothetical protein P4M08_01080 [Oligoflexia bacterium]|nr:hypothetical protein [Oligoflexia bacterium]
MIANKKWLDRASLLTLAVTVVFFLMAAIEKGLTHDLLLEAGVFLVSVKLVIANQKSELLIRGLQAKLDSIEKKVDH